MRCAGMTRRRRKKMLGTEGPAGAELEPDPPWVVGVGRSAFPKRTGNSDCVCAGACGRAGGDAIGFRCLQLAVPTHACVRAGARGGRAPSTDRQIRFPRSQRRRYWGRHVDAARWAACQRLEPGAAFWCGPCSDRYLCARGSPPPAPWRPIRLITADLEAPGAPDE